MFFSGHGVHQIILMIVDRAIPGRCRNSQQSRRCTPYHQKLRSCPEVDSLPVAVPSAVRAQSSLDRTCIQSKSFTLSQKNKLLLFSESLRKTLADLNN